MLAKIHRLRTGFPVCFSPKIPGYLQVLSRSKNYSPGYTVENFGNECKSFDTKGIL